MANIHNIKIGLPVLVLILVQVTNISTRNENGKKISWKEVEGLNADWTLSPIVNKDCLRNNICAKVSNYPRKIAFWALEQLNNRSIHGVVDKKNTVTDTLYTACDISEEILFPRAAESEDGQWYFILNLDRIPFQGFYTNRCSSHQCPRLKEPNKSKCRQEYILKPMVYLDIKNKMVAVKNFYAPTLCKCVISPEKYLY